MLFQPDQVTMVDRKTQIKHPRKKPAEPPQSINIGPHTVLTIFPNGTAGGMKLPMLGVEAIERFAREALVEHRKKAAFIEEWLGLPRGEFEPYT